MCSVCVMTAAAGASGARAGLQAVRHRWMTPRVLRAVTVLLVVGAIGGSSVSFSGSTAGPHAAQPAAAAAR